MASLGEAKEKLDKVIRQARIHFYRPTIIAEILKNHREDPSYDLREVESYRSKAMNWGGNVSEDIVGRKASSSQNYMNDLFGDKDVSIGKAGELLAVLAGENERVDRVAMVESYIYHKMEVRLDVLKDIRKYVVEASIGSFDLGEFLEKFQEEGETASGLKRSIGKIYEIAVYALFDTLVKHLNAIITVKVKPPSSKILKDFEDFTEIVLGITSGRRKIETPARLYRAGVTNAADRGLDIWGNFGPAIQVKHVSLTMDLAESIAEEVSADKIVIVCLAAHKPIIERVMKHTGFSSRIQGIITQDDLKKWYKKCFTPKYRNTIGVSILDNLRKEFLVEFPSTGDSLRGFMEKRNYDKIKMQGIFAADD